MSEAIESLLVDILAELRRVGSIVEGLENKQKAPTPMMNDALDRAPSPSTTSSQATAFAVRLEKLYKRAGNGGYDWKAANAAAMKFLRKHSPEDRDRVCAFVDSEHGHAIKERLPVYPGMYDELWDYMIRNGG